MKTSPTACRPQATRSLSPAKTNIASTCIGLGIPREAKKTGQAARDTTNPWTEYRTSSDPPQQITCPTSKASFRFRKALSSMRKQMGFVPTTIDPSIKSDQVRPHQTRSDQITVYRTDAIISAKRGVPHSRALAFGSVCVVWYRVSPTVGRQHPYQPTNRSTTTFPARR